MNYRADTGSPGTCAVGGVFFFFFFSRGRKVEVSGVGRGDACLRVYFVEGSSIMYKDD